MDFGQFSFLCYYYVVLYMYFSYLMQKEELAIPRQLMIGHLHLIPLLVAKAGILLPEDAGRLLGCRLRHQTLHPPLDIRLQNCTKTGVGHVGMGWFIHSYHCSSAFYIFFLLASRAMPNLSLVPQLKYLNLFRFLIS